MWLLLCGWEQHPMLQACLGWSAHQLPSTVICPPSASASQAPPPASQRQKMSVCTNQVPHMRYKLQCAAWITLIASIFYANVIASWGACLQPSLLHRHAGSSHHHIDCLDLLDYRALVNLTVISRKCRL